MDLLTDILQEAGLKRRLVDLRSLDTQSALQFPCEKSMGLHVVTRGRAFIHSTSLKEPLAIEAGSVVLMARGCTHVLSTLPTYDPAQVFQVTGDLASTPMAYNPSPDASTLISGAYQFWHDPVHALFREIPDWFVLDGQSLSKFHPLTLTIGLLDEELNKPSMGGQTIMYGLLDVIFTYLVREMVDQIGQARTGWSQAVADLQIRRAVTVMHEDPAHGWTLEELAKQAGLSRTLLAERFRRTMGDTPLSYLRSLRVQKAMTLLSEADHSLEQVARAVGFSDAFSFSKVFKKIVGQSPSAFRRQAKLDQTSPWKLRTG
jgi:AraC-like DNA-binding protein